MRHLNKLLLLFSVAVMALALSGASGDALWLLRLPRVATGFVVGALLALAGVAMQVLLRNPLADPYVLGTSSGAALGAIAALMCGLAMWMGAALGAVLATLALVWLARRVLRLSNQESLEANAQLILIGAMLAATLGAGATVLLTMTPDEQLRGAVFWLVGDLSSAVFSPFSLVVAYSLLMLFVLYLYARGLAIDRLQLGAQTAWQLGEPVARLRWELLLCASCAVACAVALSGAIGFVGLAVPQCLRLAGVFATRRMAYLAALMGGILLVAADALARNVAYPLELPVGAIMALLGAPLFAWFLSRGSH